MSNLRVCVLGAAGSIGSRLVAQLIKQGYQVTGVVRSLTSAVRIARFDIQLIPLDVSLADLNDLTKILKGHDVVIDCTYSSNKNYQECLNESKKTARLICDAAIQAKVDRIINLGTISVYPDKLLPIDESVECIFQNDPYADGKLVAEKVYLEEYKEKLSTTVLQLPIVFGPYMGWTISPIAQMTGKCLMIPDDFSGWCSPLYVDDAITAILLAIENDASSGHRILISDESRSWFEYYQAYTKRSKSLNIITAPRHEIDSLQAIDSFKNKPYQRLKNKFTNDGDFRQLILSQWGIRTIYKLIKRTHGQDGLDRIKTKLDHQKDSMVQSDMYNILNSTNVELFDNLSKVNTTKAEEILGMSAYTDFNQAIDDTCDWLKWARLID